MTAHLLVWVNRNCLRCFSCGGEVPWWNAELWSTSAGYPIRQWHRLCYSHWFAYAVGWRRMAEAEGSR